MFNPVTFPDANMWNYSLLRRLEPSSSGAYTGSYQNANNVSDTVDANFIFGKNGFKLQPNKDDYPFLAGHPIVWLQIKF